MLCVVAAPESALERGVQAVNELRAADAVRELDEARARGPWTHVEHTRLYSHLGIAYAYLGRPDDALTAFRWLLALSPGFALPYTLSPKATFLFERARDKARSEPPPAIDLGFPRDGRIDAPLPLTVEVLADPLGFMSRLELYFRLRGEPHFRKLEHELVAGQRYLELSLPAEKLEESTVRELYAVVKDARGSEVLLQGSPGFPREAPAAYVPQLRWYQRWWVWALVGVGVAAGVSGIVYGATRPPPDSIAVEVMTSR